MKIRTFGVSDHDAYWADRESKGRTREKELHRFIVKQLQEFVPAGGTVLDCGVGDGHVMRLAQQHFNAFGVELSPEAFKFYDFPTDQIRIADLNDGIPEFGIKFDAIVASNVLHWLDSPSTFLAAIRKALTEKGKAVVVVPNITNYHYRIGFIFGKFPPVSPSHKNFQTPTEVENMFQKAGYQIEKRLSQKKSLKAKLWPTLFGMDIIYVLRPVSSHD